MEPYKILVVDDNADYLSRIIDLLNETEESFTFFQAFNGNMACSIAEKKLPDLIITDWEMPVMDGIEFVKHLKSKEITKDIPVIMCTGVMTEVENLKTALDAGAVDYIRKPVEKQELIARVHSMLKLSQSVKKVKNQNIELQELNATKDKFFSIISHDLRGPIGSFKSLIELMLSGYNFYDNKNHLKILQMFHKTANSTYDLLENLLSWAKSQRNEIAYAPEEIILDEIVLSTLNLFAELAQNKQIDIVSHISENIIIRADKNMLMTVFRNLISNAIKFTPNGKQIQVFATKNEMECLITIKDEGIGIEPENLSKLFKNSEHLTTRGTDGEKGTGLGLLLCKDFVEKHSGKIWVDSELGKGSEFKFTIPQS